MLMWTWYLATGLVAGAAGAGWTLASSGVPRWRTRLTTVAVWASVALLLVVAARLWSQTYDAFGGDEPLTWLLVRVIVTETSWGTGWTWQFLGAASCVIVATVWKRQWDMWPLFLVCAVGTAFATGLTGHAVGMEEDQWITILAHGFHVVAVGLWLGTLTMILASSRGAMHDENERARFGAVVERFSPLAVAAVTTLVTAGAVASWRHVGSIDGLWTPYGNVLLGKIGAFSAAAACGFYNWRVLRPKMLTSGDATRRLRQISSLEIAFGVLALVIQAYLGTLSMPGHDH